MAGSWMSMGDSVAHWEAVDSPKFMITKLIKQNENRTSILRLDKVFDGSI